MSAEKNIILKILRKNNYQPKASFNSEGKIKIFNPLAGWPTWLEHHPAQQKVVDLIPGQGTYGRQLMNDSLSHRCFSSTVSLSKINKHILGWGLIKYSTQEWFFITDRILPKNPLKNYWPRKELFLKSGKYVKYNNNLMIVKANLEILNIRGK